MRVAATGPVAAAILCALALGAPAPVGAQTAPAPAAPPLTAPEATPGVPAAVPAAAPAAAPAASGLLTVDQDALYTESQWGRRAASELEARKREVLAENDRIAAQLESEDDALTALRPTLDPEEFRRRADAFDVRVQQVRSERDAAGQALVASDDADRAAFFNAALPVFAQLMGDRGATVILDRRTVFLSADAVDATSELVARIDAALGAGPAQGAVATTPNDAAAPTQAPTQTPGAAPAEEANPAPDAPAPDAAIPSIPASP